MPFCPNCGKEISVEANFCPSCGYNLKQVSPAKPIETQQEKFFKTMNATIKGYTYLGWGIILFIVIVFIAVMMSTLYFILAFMIGIPIALGIWYVSKVKLQSVRLTGSKTDIITMYRLKSSILGMLSVLALILGLPSWIYYYYLPFKLILMFVIVLVLATPYIGLKAKRFSSSVRCVLFTVAAALVISQIFVFFLLDYWFTGMSLYLMLGSGVVLFLSGLFSLKEIASTSNPKE